MALLQIPYGEPTITIQEGPDIKRAKRIKLTISKKSRINAIQFINLLDNASTSNETFQLLIQISDSLQFDEKELPEIIKKLCENYKRDESYNRVKILFLFGDFVSEMGADGVILVDEIISLLKTEESSKAGAQGLNSIYRIAKTQNLPPSTCSKIVDLARSKLTSYSHNIQRHAILLIGVCANLFEADNELLELVSKFTDSQDARVRAQSFNSILTMGKRGVKLSPNLYSRVTAALKDDYECVRKEALPLIFEIGTKHSEILLSITDSDSELRLIDDAFGKVCSSISDLSINVRTQAAMLLGGMGHVSSEFLHQTLDKKLMSNMRRKKSLHERAKENFMSGEWSSGKKWADDAPKELISSDSISLIDSGACGALVQALEDEYLEVREAAVHSMCSLAIENPLFAVTSLDFLVDMFNDEIESVRLEAIYSLTKISEHIVLREDQLEIMLSSLEDYSVEVREGLHLMLGACKVSTKACLTLVVQKMLDVLAKYPQDKLSAFGCLQKVGQKHPELCMSLTPHLLQDHPFFDSAEKDVEDPAYVCVLIMLFNAARHLPPMLSLFPDTTVKHYSYLRDTMPNFVPQLQIGDASIEMSLIGSTDSRQFLQTLLTNIKATIQAPKARQALLQAAQDNLDRLAAHDPSLSGTANFTGDFLGAQLLIERLQSSMQNQQVQSAYKESLNLLIRKCLRLQNLYANLTSEDLLLVKQICLRASALNLVIIVRDKSQSALAACQLLLHIAANAFNFVQETPSVQPDKFTKAILSQLESVNDPKPGRVFREILPIVLSAGAVASPDINVNIKMCVGRIIEPNETSSNESIIKVTAGLIAAIPIVAEIDNLQEAQRQDLRIKIKYPDQNIHSVVPRIRDLKKLPVNNRDENENIWRLRTQILLSHGIWTEASQVEVSICLSVKPSSEIQLGKPIKVCFAPKPVKRGI